MMVAGFEGDEGRGTTSGLTRCTQREHLGVRPSGALVPALPDDPLALDDDATDPRVRLGAATTEGGEFERARHRPSIGGGTHHGRALVAAARRLADDGHRAFRGRLAGGISLAAEQRQLTREGLTPPARTQLVDLVAERLDVLEAAVHRREAHIGDFVEVAQFLHHELAHLARSHLALTERAQAVGDALDGGFDLLLLDRTLLQRAQDARTQLLLVEGLAFAMAFDDQRHHELGGLEGGEALAAGEALAPPTDLPTLRGKP